MASQGQTQREHPPRKGPNSNNYLKCLSENAMFGAARGPPRWSFTTTFGHTKMQRSYSAPPSRAMNMPWGKPSKKRTDANERRIHTSNVQMTAKEWSVLFKFKQRYLVDTQRKQGQWRAVRWLRCTAISSQAPPAGEGIKGAGASNTYEFTHLGGARAGSSYSCKPDGHENGLQVQKTGLTVLAWLLHRAEEMLNCC